jgi:hypothetical protein
MVPLGIRNNIFHSTPYQLVVLVKLNVLSSPHVEGTDHIKSSSMQIVSADCMPDFFHQGKSVFAAIYKHMPCQVKETQTLASSSFTTPQSNQHEGYNRHVLKDHSRGRVHVDIGTPCALW